MKNAFLVLGFILPLTFGCISIAYWTGTKVIENEAIKRGYMEYDCNTKTGRCKLEWVKNK